MASKGVLRIKIAGDTGPLEKSMDGATKVLKGFAKAGVAIFAGLGVAAGAVLVKEFGNAVAQGKLQDKLGAQLGLTEAEAEKAGKIAGDLYADAYGDSIEQVHDAVGAVMSSLGDLDDGAVEDLTAKALDLATAFDVDVNESVNAAGVLMRTGLARDADHAFDLIVSSMQSVPQAMRGELIPIIEEYSQDFGALGIDGEDAFGLLVDAAQDGRIELDKTGDAIKELTIRSTDMSTASKEAYDTIGLDAKEMADAIVQGGDTAREAFDKIVDGLIAIEDPSVKANTSIALMGTPLEDLSVTEIPAFLQRLDEMGGGFGEVEGAATRMGDQLNDNVATDFESFKRKASETINNWIQENVLPGAATVMAAFEEDGIGGALSAAVELWREAQPEVEAWFEDTFVPFWEDTAVPWMEHVGGALGTALVNALADVAGALLPKALEAVINSLNLAVEEAIGGINKAISDIFFGGAGQGSVFGKPNFGRVSFEGFDVANLSNPVDRPTGLNSNPSVGDTSSRIPKFHSGGLVTSSLPRFPGDGPSERTIRAQVGETVNRGSGDVIQNFYGPVTDQVTGRSAALALRMA